MRGSPLRILVVGAGIAGLAVARALRLAGFRPTSPRDFRRTNSPDTGLYLPGNAARGAARLGPRRPGPPLGQVIHRQRFLDAAGDLCEVDLDALWAGVGECRALPRRTSTRCCSAGPGARFGTAPR